MASTIKSSTLRLFAELLDMQAENARSDRFRAERQSDARIAREIADRIDAGETKPEIMAAMGLSRNEHGGFWDVCPAATQRIIDKLRAAA